ncbi:MAG: carboxylesterase family protein, partial [Pseudomonadota bacterium]
MTSKTAKPISFETTSGTITASRGSGLIRATGIPYASAGRFELPQAVTRKAGPIDGTNPAPACPQNPVPELEALLGVQSPTLPENEACHNLSITVPDAPSKEKRPVMVWIHGGSYVAGAGDSPIFDVGPLCREQDVIVVSVTYRLGLLGFLGGYAGRPANLGLLDIIEAL